MKYFLTDHAFKRAEEREITKDDINACVTLGKCYKSKMHGGQLRFMYNGVVVIVKNKTNNILTCYRLNHIR
jgi:hypothetical protein